MSSQTDLVNAALEDALYYGAVSGYTATQVNSTFLGFATAAQQGNQTYSQLDLAQYTSAYFWNYFMRRIRNDVIGSMRPTMCFLGFIGYILELIILFAKSEDFNTVSFYYHKTIAILELPDMLCVGISTVNDWLPAAQVGPVWTYTNYYGTRLSKILSMASDAVTLMTSIERFIAIWLPTKFYKVNRRKVALSLIGLSILYGCLKIPSLFEDYYTFDSNGASHILPTALGASAVYVAYTNTIGIIDIVKGILIGILAVLICIGLMRVARKQRNLINKSSPESEEYQIKKQLCALSLTCSIPVFFNTIFYFVQFNILAVYITGNQAVSSYNLAGAMAQMNIANANYLVGFFVIFSQLLAHCTHFYAYVAFSQRFRKATIRQLKLGKMCTNSATVEPSVMAKGFSTKNIVVSIAPSANQN